jgi:hypothetical protein
VLAFELLRLRRPGRCCQQAPNKVDFEGFLWTRQLDGQVLGPNEERVTMNVAVADGISSPWARRSENDPFAARKVIHLGA